MKTIKTVFLSSLFLMAQVSAAPKVILFDVFGTCVEVRNSLIEQGQKWSKENNRRIAWSYLVDAWIEDHVESIQAIREGKQPWMTVDEIHERSLSHFLEVSKSDRETIVQFWHKLKPWPDTMQGLISLRQQYKIGTLSNGNESLLNNLSISAVMPWHYLFSSEQSKHYKPDVEAYEYPLTQLKIQPSEALLVAAHPYDLQAAKKLGWKTAFVMRPGEFSGYTKAKALKEFDYVAMDFIELSKQLLK